MAKKEIYDGAEEYIVLSIPVNTKKLKVECELKDGQKGIMKLKREEINEAREMYLKLDPYDMAFDVFTFTEKGRELFERLTEDDLR